MMDVWFREKLANPGSGLRVELESTERNRSESMITHISPTSYKKKVNFSLVLWNNDRYFSAIDQLYMNFDAS